MRTKHLLMIALGGVYIASGIYTFTLISALDRPDTFVLSFVAGHAIAFGFVLALEAAERIST